MDVCINNRSRAKLNEKKIVDLVLYFKKLFKLDFEELSLAFVGDTVIRRINMKCRGINRSTDILSFEGEGNNLGELIIDYSQIKRQAPYYSKNCQNELLFIIIHGLLHLIGYTDDKDKDRLAMMDKGKKILVAYNNLKIKKI